MAITKATITRLERELGVKLHIFPKEYTDLQKWMTEFARLREAVDRTKLLRTFAVIRSRIMLKYDDYLELEKRGLRFLVDEQPNGNMENDLLSMIDSPWDFVHFALNEARDILQHPRMTDIVERFDHTQPSLEDWLDGLAECGLHLAEFEDGELAFMAMCWEETDASWESWKTTGDGLGALSLDAACDTTYFFLRALCLRKMKEWIQENSVFRTE